MYSTDEILRLLNKLPDATRSELVKIAGSYPAFRTRYKNDPAGFVRDCIRWGDNESPSPYQYEILDAISKNKRYSVRGPHGLGKTAIAAWVILWFALTRDGETDWKIPCTASVWRQLSKFLMPEVHKWAGRIIWEKIGRPPFSVNNELHDLSLKLSTGEAFALASNDPSSIEGAHASSILYIFDEAKAIDDAIWDAAEGALSVGDSHALAISTPGAPVGRFYDIQSRKTGFQDWAVRHITKDEAIAAGRIDNEWVEARRLQWGETSAIYINRVLGDFAANDEEGVISLSDIERSNERWLARQESDGFKVCTGFGVDIGRGGDKSVIACEYDDNAIYSLERMDTRNSMEVAGRVKGLLNKHVSASAVIDLGYDPGVYDRLHEQMNGERIIPFVAAAHEDMKDETGELGFVNLRSAAWWNLRELLKHDLYDLPPDDQLTGDLTAPKWTIKSGGRIAVESKTESNTFGEGVRARLGRSTDDGDAVVMIAMKKNLRGDVSFAGRGTVEGFKSRWTE